MKKYLKTASALLLAVILSLQQALPVRAWEEIVTCTVLGDSIAKGYSSDKANKIDCYGRIVTERIAEENEIYFDYQNYAKNGLDTQSLNEKVLSRDTVKRNLNKSDLIFLTMGSNDLMNEFKKEAQEILNSNTKFRSAPQAMNELQEAVKINPLLVLKIIDALSSWDYESFESEWAAAMQTITQQKKDTAQIIVTNIYNPIYNMQLPGTMNKVVEDIIQNMNSIIEKRAEEFNYQVVDLFNSNIVAFVQGDGLHPSQEGQQLIAEMVYDKIQPVDANTQSVDGQAVKGENIQEGNTKEETETQVSPGKTKQPSIQESDTLENEAGKAAKKSKSVFYPYLFSGIIIIILAVVLTIYIRKKNKTK